MTDQSPKTPAGPPLSAATGSEPVCACVHHDSYECARIRDGDHMRDEDSYHRRQCECICHDDPDYDYDDEDWGRHSPNDKVSND